MTQEGQRVVLRRHPIGALRPEDFSIEAQSALAPGEGEFLVRTLFVSVDPMLRIFIDSAPLGGTFPAMPPGTTIPGPAVGEIIESRHPNFHSGEFVEGRFGWQNFAVSNGAGVNKVNRALGGPANALSIGGLPGFTAYVGLRSAGGVKPGQTVLVSGAAGAVGSVVGPLVQAAGGRAVGIAAGAAKCAYLVEKAGYAAAADRTAEDFTAQLARALPNGADLYFDNVGGPMLPRVLPFLARGALILICGLMDQYQGEDRSGPDHLPALLRAVMGKGVRLQSFTQAGQQALRPAFEAEMAALVAAGKIDVPLHVEEGIERLPYALCGLFDKAVAGKVLVRVAAPVETTTHSRIVEETS